MSDIDGNTNARKKTLLQKYDMPVECLSFEHIEKCNKVKDLEKILKVLRSGEEGHYAHLEKAAEDKLRKLAPNNHLLRIDAPVISTSALGAQERQTVSNDMQEWAQEMSSRESLLKSGESLNTDEAPAVRNSPVVKTVNEKNMNEKNNMNKSTSPKLKERKCVPNDYTFWDKFDADSEIMKMDLEEERFAEKKSLERKRQEEQLRQKVQSATETNAFLDKVMGRKHSTGAGDGLSLPEREYNALQEKIKGNEYFRNHDYLKALDHYSKSISFLPTVDAYNNRAQSYLKLEDFSSALRDCQTVLGLDPSNAKALFRRGAAFFSLEKYQDALDDFETALEIEPNDKYIQDFAKKAHMKLGIPVSSKRVRVAIQEKVTSDLVEEVSDVDTNDKYYPFFNTSPNDDIALNAIGTAKVMCRCNGTPGFMKKVRSLDDLKDRRLFIRRSSRPQKKEVLQEQHPPSDDSAQASKSPQQSVDDIASSACSKAKEDNSTKNGNKDGQSIKSFSNNSRQSSAKMSGTTLALSNLEKLKSPFSFSVFWSSIKNTDDLTSVAKALRVLCPEQISQVVGNKLEEKMLSSFILALRKLFSIPDEWGIVQRYLLSFTQLPRFSFVNMMLDKTTKKELEMLLNEAESHGLRVSDLLQLYCLTTCP